MTVVYGQPIPEPAIRRAFFKRGLSQRQVAKESGLAESTVNRAFNGRPVAPRVFDALRRVLVAHPADGADELLVSA